MDAFNKRHYFSHNYYYASLGLINDPLPNCLVNDRNIIIIIIG